MQLVILQNLAEFFDIKNTEDHTITFVRAVDWKNFIMDQKIEDRFFFEDSLGRVIVRDPVTGMHLALCLFWGNRKIILLFKIMEIYYFVYSGT